MPIRARALPLEVAAGLERGRRAGRLSATPHASLGALEVVFVGSDRSVCGCGPLPGAGWIFGIRVANAAYVECALRAGTTLVTADRHLARACAQSGVPVVALADLRPR